MQTSVTPLTARSQTLIASLFGVMGVMALSPLFEVAAMQWPFRFGEVAWRYKTLMLLLANGPQLVVLIGVLAVLASLVGHRKAVRAASFALALVAGLTLIPLMPLATLDYFQVRHLIGVVGTSQFKAMFIKTMFFALLVVAGGGWASWLGLQASEGESSRKRRTKGDGLVVGQPKGSSRTPTAS